MWNLLINKNEVFKLIRVSNFEYIIWDCPTSLTVLHQILYKFVHFSILKFFEIDVRMARNFGITDKSASQNFGIPYSRIVIRSWSLYYQLTVPLKWNFLNNPYVMKYLSYYGVIVWLVGWVLALD